MSDVPPTEELLVDYLDEGLGAVGQDEVPDRTVVLLGTTGSGKSTLGNVLAGREMEFDEMASADSKTKDTPIKTYRVKFNGKSKILRIIDTLGLSDTKRKPSEVMAEIGALSVKCCDGVDNVFIVTHSRLTAAEIEAFKTVQFAILRGQSQEYTSIVHTHFDDYDDPPAVAKLEEGYRKAIQELEDEHPDSPGRGKRLGFSTFFAVNNPSVRKSSKDDTDRRACRNMLFKHIFGQQAKGEKCHFNTAESAERARLRMEEARFEKLDATFNLLLKQHEEMLPVLVKAVTDAAASQAATAMAQEKLYAKMAEMKQPEDESVTKARVRQLDAETEQLKRSAFARTFFGLK